MLACFSGYHQAVFEYMEVDYNQDPRHSANGFISLVAFEDQKAAK